MPATLTAPKTTTDAELLTILAHPSRCGWERYEDALKAAARKAGIGAYAHRLRYYGASCMDRDADWKSTDAVRDMERLERRIGRRLADHDRRTFLAAMIEMMNDLV
jgi:hypothetical protein